MIQRCGSALLLCSVTLLPSFGATPAPRAQTLMQSLPLRFEPNVGQLPQPVRFLSRGGGYQIHMLDDGHVLRFQSPQGPQKVTTHLRGANRGVRVRGEELLASQTNYLTAGAPGAAVNNYGRVRYEGIYPGIDLVFYGNAGQLEYDFVLAAGADPRTIDLTVEGSTLSIDSKGNLILGTSAGDIRWNRPVMYQGEGAARHEVTGTFVLRGTHEVGFQVAAYDAKQVLVIDPVLSYSSFVGASGNDAARGIAIDASGNVYVCGNTTSQNLANTSGTAQQAYGGDNPAHQETGDAFVAKLTPAGALAWITYLGGSADEAALGIAADAAGNSYITGYTNSNNFRTSAGAHQSTFGGQGRGSMFHEGGDAFLAKLNPSGSTLLYSTLLGGSLDDRGIAIALDNGGAIYVTGNTLSSNFPTFGNPLQSQYRGGTTNDIISGGDAFVTKFSAAGALVYSTYVGGSGNDAPAAIAVDSTGSAYVAGGTASTNFPTTTGAFQTASAGTADAINQPYFTLGDAFVVKLNPAGTALTYATLLGGNRDETALGLAIDSSGAAYVTGITSSGNFPTVANAPQRTFGGPTAILNGKYFWMGDGFVSKLNPAGSALVYSTYFGGADDDAGWAIAVDGAGNAYVAGSANSTDFKVTTDALQQTKAGSGGQSLPIGDGVLLKLNPAGSAFLYASYFGGSSDDAIAGIALDATGAAFVTGSTASANFPTTATAAQRVYGGRNSVSLVVGDAFVTKFAEIATPGVVLTRVANAANYVDDAVAPGEMVVLGGTNIGPTALLGAALGPDGRLATTVSETRVLFDGVAAPIVYVYATQTAVVVPYIVVGRANTQIQVEYKGALSAPLTLPVKAAVPGLFSNDASGAGQGAIYNEDNSRNLPNNPAERGHIIVIYGTGEGQTTPAGSDGKIASVEFPKPALPVSVTVGGKPATILYAGAVPFQSAGIFQINLVVPVDVDATVPQPVVVSFGPTSKTQANLTVSLK